jgi:hypothetical protein
MFETLKDLRNRLESAEHTLKETEKRIAAELKEMEERDAINARLAQIQKETEALQWKVTTRNCL